MKCKFCQAELEEENSVCPVCGKDNAAEDLIQPAEDLTQPAEAVPETADEAAQGCSCCDCGQTDTENEPAPAQKKKSPLAVSLIVAGAVILVALLVVMVLKGAGVIGKEPFMVKGPDGQLVEATLASDGQDGEVTEKGSYTVSDRKAASAGDVVVATCGEYELTNAELQSLYWMNAYNFMKNYGSYAAAKGLDFTVPLDMQACGLEEGLTWQQYFLKTALSSWHMYQTLRIEAAEAGFQMPADMKTYLDGLEENLGKIAAENKFETALDMIQADMGAGSTMEGYKSYMRSYYEGYAYYGQLVETIAPSEEEVKAYFEKHIEDFEKQGINKDTLQIDVRHCLVEPVAEEGAKPTEEAWAEAEKKAQALLDEWMAGDKTEESFAAMADANTADPGSKGKGGLYQHVKQGDMVPEFDAWCFDASRKVGDTGIVKSQFGYHIMYFSASAPLWPVPAEQQLKGELLTQYLDNLKVKYPAEFDYSAMVLGYVDQAPKSK